MGIARVGVVVACALVACSSSPSDIVVVKGRLTEVGSQWPGDSFPRAGEVRAVAEDGRVTAEQTGDDGLFRLLLGPGTYQLHGSLPSRPGVDDCSALKPVVVAPGTDISVDVLCLDG